MTSARPTGTVTFLFTDIEGSTRMAQEHRRTWESLRDRHHAILRAALEAHEGYLFEVVGDSFCIAFHSPE
ncbi:MAG TPA: adenylate/guanylate cyclase domain-containing protein, partial [Anaerolineales bacterium]|nr:adenylate/guanylate cyclase domain-containing protein [Anaerolineales bacterium]